MDNRNEVFSDKVDLNKVDLNKGGVFTSQPDETMTGDGTVRPRDSVAQTPDNAAGTPNSTFPQQSEAAWEREAAAPVPGPYPAPDYGSAAPVPGPYPAPDYGSAAPVPDPAPDCSSAGPVPDPYPARNYGPAGPVPNPHAAPDYGSAGHAPNPDMSPDYGYGSRGYSYGEGFYQYPEQGGYERGMEVPVSMGEWLISMLLMLIPCVNIVLMLIWGFSDKEKKSKSNYFKARLIFCGIEIGLIFVWLIFYGFIMILML